VRWDHPPLYGIARKRDDCRTRQSPFNSRNAILAALRHCVSVARCRYLLVSFSNEGYVTRPDMEALLSERGRVTVVEHDFKHYVGAQIGIYNPRGEKVGKIRHLRNKECLCLVDATS
jgi:adenine-specific DNA-methyltransferase